MIVLLRLLAIVGSVAHGIDQLVARILGFLPFRLPGAVLVASLLLVASVASVQGTSDAIATGPQPVKSTVSDLVADPVSAWVRVSGLLSGPHLDNSIYASADVHYFFQRDEAHDHQRDPYGQIYAPTGWQHQTFFVIGGGEVVTRWFYVLRDPEQHEVALVVRSARDSDAIRLRSVEAKGAADDGLLVEVADAADAEPTASVTDVPDSGTAIVRGTFTDGVERACDSGPTCVNGRTWRYRLTDADDPARSALIDSPHAPEAMPVTLVGVATADPIRMNTVLATDQMRAALGGADHPESMVLADGIGPQIPEVTYVGAVVPGVLAAVVLLSALIPYPLFRRTRGAGRTDLERPVVDELLPLVVDGRLPVPGADRGLAGTLATLGWIPGRELARRAWHLHAGGVDANDDRPRLALLALESSFVLPLEPIRADLDVTPGLVATSSGVRPGLRLRGGGVNATLAFSSDTLRDRAWRELDPSTAAPAIGPIPEALPVREAWSPSWARPAAALALAVAGVALISGAALGLITGEATPLGVGVGVLAAVALAALAAGVARRSWLALELLPSAGLLGIVIAGMIAASTVVGCTAWLAPNLTSCATFDLPRLVPPLVAVAAFSLSLWAVPHLARERSRAAAAD